MMMISQFNGTSTPKGSYSAKTGDNDCNVICRICCSRIYLGSLRSDNLTQELASRYDINTVDDTFLFICCLGNADKFCRWMDE